MITTDTGIELGIYTDDHTPATWGVLTGALITGAAGSGKTRACVRIATETASLVPTHIHTTSPRGDLDALLAERGLEVYPARPEELAETVRLRHDHHLNDSAGWPTPADPLLLILLDEIPHTLDTADEDTRRTWAYIATHGPRVGVIPIATSFTTWLAPSFGGDAALRDALAFGARLTLHTGRPRGRGTFAPSPIHPERPIEIHRN